MNYVVPAARQLVDEVEALGVTDGKAEVLPELDGLGFHREVRLNQAVVKALGEDVVSALGADPRIAQMVASNKGLRVVFVPDAPADHDDPFGLALVLEKRD